MTADSKVRRQSAGNFVSADREPEPDRCSEESPNTKLVRVSTERGPAQEIRVLGPLTLAT